MITRRDWWIGVLLIVGGLFFHAVFPRYEWRHFEQGPGFGLIRIDRWTGSAEFGHSQASGQWRAGL